MNDLLSSITHLLNGSLSRSVIINIALIAVVIFFILFFIIIGQLGRSKKLKRLEEDHETFTNFKKRSALIDKSSFKICPIMNKGEWVAYNWLKDMLERRRSNLSVFTQTPLIAMIKETTKGARQLQRGLYSDFVLVDRELLPVVVVEIDGSGHSYERDEVKDKILASVGIHVIRVDTSKWDQQRPRQKYITYVQRSVENAVNAFIQKHPNVI